MNDSFSRIGLLGGTFNPIHIGHLIQAEEVRRIVNLDKVFLVPCRTPPHKTEKDLCEIRHRMEMIRLAIANNPFFELSEFEANRESDSYSFYTIKHFIETNANTEVFFIIGIDAFAEINSWYRYQDVLRMTRFIITSRGGYKIGPNLEEQNSVLRSYLDHFEILSDSDKLLPNRFGLESRNYVVKILNIDVSSTEMRNRLRQGRSIRYLTPQAVKEYIEHHRLYTTSNR